MNVKLPGTTIEIHAFSEEKENAAARILDTLFAAGGLVMSQIVTLTGLEYYIVQNWIKRGFVAPPVKKQYSRRQFCRIVLINMLKDTLQIEKIVKLLSYINGVLDDESDDLIDDAALYNIFVNLLFAAEKQPSEEPKKLIAYVLRDYQEPIPGGLKKMQHVLEAMYHAYLAAKYREKCEQIIYELD